MADEENPPELPMPHVETSQFRTIFANGAVFTGPVDAAKNWMLTFYTEGIRIASETLVSTDVSGRYTHASPPKIETHRVRRDEVCVIIPERQLESLLSAVAATMKGGEG
jgi:hypothetical protein